MSQKDYDMNPRWYVVHTYSGYENKVKTDLEKTIKNRELEEYFFDIIVPMEEQIEIKDGKKKTNLKKVFPGYVLVKMIVTEETWYIVRNTRGVTGFVGSGTDPIPLTDDEIRNMGFEEASINVDYEINEQVEVMNGAFEGFVGTVQEINKEKHKVKISVFNTGDTLSEENLERIWGRFYKVDESRNRADGGTGIGLALVKAIMNNYNSKYGAVNRENGIEFYFDIQTDAGIEK